MPNHLDLTAGTEMYLSPESVTPREVADLIRMLEDPKGKPKEAWIAVADGRCVPLPQKAREVLTGVLRILALGHGVKLTAHLTVAAVHAHEGDNG